MRIVVKAICLEEVAVKQRCRGEVVTGSHKSDWTWRTPTARQWCTESIAGHQTEASSKTVGNGRRPVPTVMRQSFPRRRWRDWREDDDTFVSVHFLPFLSPFSFRPRGGRENHLPGCSRSFHVQTISEKYWPIVDEIQRKTIPRSVAFN